MKKVDSLDNVVSKVEEMISTVWDNQKWLLL